MRFRLINSFATAKRDFMQRLRVWEVVISSILRISASISQLSAAIYYFREKFSPIVRHPELFYCESVLAFTFRSIIPHSNDSTVLEAFFQFSHDFPHISVLFTFPLAYPCRSSMWPLFLWFDEVETICWRKTSSLWSVLSISTWCSLFPHAFERFPQFEMAQAMPEECT